MKVKSLWTVSASFERVALVRVTTS